MSALRFSKSHTKYVVHSVISGIWKLHELFWKNLFVKSSIMPVVPIILLIFKLSLDQVYDGRLLHLQSWNVLAHFQVRYCSTAFRWSCDIRTSEKHVSMRVAHVQKLFHVLIRESFKRPLHIHASLRLTWMCKSHFFRISRTVARFRKTHNKFQPHVGNLYRSSDDLQPGTDDGTFFGCILKIFEILLWQNFDETQNVALISPKRPLGKYGCWSMVDGATLEEF